MSEIPDELHYTDEHEWIRVDGTVARLGITDFAQEALGDVVFVTLPELGAVLVKSDAFGEVESTKSVSEIFAPLDGTVIAVNDLLEAEPALVNTDPYGDGWIVEIEVADPAQVEDLLDAAAYGTLAS